jgi:hypothetical protein
MNPGVLQAKPSEIVALLSRQGDLPSLKGDTVTLIGIGDTAQSQGQLSPNQQAELVKIWSAVVTASGAMVHVDYTPT